MHYDMYSELSNENNQKYEKINLQLKRKKDISKRTFDIVVGNDMPNRKLYDSPLPTKMNKDKEAE